MIPNEIVSITSGAVAGLLTDSILYPIDTIKTRLQSTRTILKTNLYRNLFAGLPTVIAVSAPNAAIFFLSYEYVKRLNESRSGPAMTSVAAALGEVSACLVRCPFEVLKQRSQDQPQTSVRSILAKTVAQEGVLGGLYRGYLSMVLREIPFSVIQFPVWEQLKRVLRQRQDHELRHWQSALCGFCAGGIAALLTTPLDVAKTRIMLSQKGTAYDSLSLVASLRQIFVESGARGLFFGVVPRVIQISFGGAIFLGAYDIVRNALTR